MYFDINLINNDFMKQGPGVYHCMYIVFPVHHYKLQGSIILLQLLQLREENSKFIRKGREKRIENVDRKEKGKKGREKGTKREEKER